MKIFTYQDIGNRNLNQDYLLTHKLSNGCIAMVADGCGAYNGSEFAAKFFCEHFLDHFLSTLENFKEHPRDTIFDALVHGQQQMSNYLNDQKLKQACTTVVIFIKIDTQAYSVHIGDSRLYLLTNDNPWHTDDHSVPYELLKNKKISQAEYENHPDLNILTNVIDIYGDLKPDINELHCNKGCKILLCTDGFWDGASKEFLQELYNSKTPKRLLEQHGKNLIKAQADADNQSAILISL